MTAPSIALKVDVDTYAGTRDGVPRLLGILDDFGIRATFYFSMGPDNSGKAIRRIFTRKGFLKKMLRTKAPSAYGLKTMLYGTILPPPMISSRLPNIIKKAGLSGHEVGIHCWDHVRWHDLLPSMPKEKVAIEIEKARAAFLEIMGYGAKTMAAPGWTVSASSLEIQDTLCLDYCSDCRGTAPFYPVFEGKRYKTLQIPTTLPTMDELIGEGGINANNINAHYLGLIRPGLNTHTIHAELEGGILAPVFIDLMRRLQQKGVIFTSLKSVAKAALISPPPDSALSMGELAGRAGLVALQEPAKY